jgi:hypothetical protein
VVIKTVNEMAQKNVAKKVSFKVFSLYFSIQYFLNHKINFNYFNSKINKSLKFKFALNSLPQTQKRCNFHHSIIVLIIICCISFKLISQIRQNIGSKYFFSISSTHIFRRSVNSRVSVFFNNKMAHFHDHQTQIVIG